MATLRYWDKYSSSWRPVGGASAVPGYVPLSGGTITGDLVVDSGDPWEMHVGTNGTLKAGSIRTPADGIFDGNIRLSTVRTVDLGGAVVQHVSEPLYDDSAATKGYVDDALVRTAEAVEPTLGRGWQALGEGYGPPRYRLGASGRCVVLEGLLMTNGAFIAPLPEPTHPMFVLPKGYRPPARVIFMVVGGKDSLFSCAVNPTGEVWLHGYSGEILDAGQFLSLDGCRFPMPQAERPPPVGG